LGVQLLQNQKEFFSSSILSGYKGFD
jgi:hypothetical protein